MLVSLEDLNFYCGEEGIFEEQKESSRINITNMIKECIDERRFA